MKFFPVILILLLAPKLWAQNDTVSVDSIAGRGYLIQNVDRNGVVMPEVPIKEVTVVGRPAKESARRSEYRKYERLIYNLRKVYPYALVVRQKLSQVNYEMEQLKTDRERKEYIRKFEKDIFKAYEGDMRNMTITQGKLLIKLIDRETQNTSFNLIKEYRGGFTAAFWQGIARIFGANLKDEYDPYGNDALIELILLDIEAGNL
ncbi:MAG TPA: DUF4294 domain-containing protein [Bacteroidales bacterium]|nr:DUF4294 domain-containing protein [Bacteroidales bacterium]